MLRSGNSFMNYLQKPELMGKWIVSELTNLEYPAIRMNMKYCLINTTVSELLYWAWSSSNKSISSSLASWIIRIPYSYSPRIKFAQSETLGSPSNPKSFGLEGQEAQNYHKPKNLL